MKRRALIAATLAAGTAAPALAQMRPPSFERSVLVIESGANKHRFDIEMADTDERRAYGLMHRDKLAPDSGMLFDFKADQPVAMWMRNTRIPLDMLFISAGGKIVNIRERAVPFDETSIYSDGPVRSVLELNGGTVARLAIKPGDVVRHKLFGNPP